jgi:hypothetical protein
MFFFRTHVHNSLTIMLLSTIGNAFIGYSWSENMHMSHATCQNSLPMTQNLSSISFREWRKPSQFQQCWLDWSQPWSLQKQRTWPNPRANQIRRTTLWILPEVINPGILVVERNFDDIRRIVHNLYHFEPIQWRRGQQKEARSKATVTKPSGSRDNCFDSILVSRISQCITKSNVNPPGALNV